MKKKQTLAVVIVNDSTSRKRKHYFRLEMIDFKVSRSEGRSGDQITLTGTVQRTDYSTKMPKL